MSVDYTTLPDGYQVSVFDGEVVLTPLSDAQYWSIESLAFSARASGLPRARRLSDVLIEFPGENDAAPDFVVLAEGAAPRPGRKAYACLDVLLAAEVVSQREDLKDYGRNVAKYGRFCIPHYLIVDPYRGEITLMWEPETSGYAESLVRPYASGELSVVLSDGTALRLDLTDLPRTG